MADREETVNGAGKGGRGSRVILWCLLPVVLLVTAACSSARRGEPVAGPLPLASEELVRGRQAYLAFCDKCHPGGEAGLGPALNNKPLPSFLISFQVRRGMGAMPSFPEEVLPDRQLESLTAYMKALRRHTPR